AQQREGERPPGVDKLVLEQALVQKGEPAGRDEAAARERREAVLVRAALGREAPFHDAEGALGTRGVGGPWEREPRAEAVVAALVVDGRLDAHEALSSAQFEQRDDVDCALAHARALDDPLRPPVSADDP